MGIDIFVYLRTIMWRSLPNTAMGFSIPILARRRARKKQSMASRPSYAQQR